MVSSQEFESFGLTIVEAMTLSTPIVATNVGEIPEVLGLHKGGYCIPLDDINTYANKIVILLKSKRLRKEVSAEGYMRYKKNFNVKKMVKSYVDLIKAPN